MVYRGAVAYAASDLFRPEAHYTAPTYPERFALILNSNDRKFAALAHAAGAILISNDDHLSRHRDRMDLTVLTPHEFWQRQQHSHQVSERR